jgi:hypothetical protein
VPFAPPPSLDLATTFPELAGLRRAVGMGDWPGIRHFFDTLADPDDYIGAVRIVGEVGGAERFLSDVVRREGAVTLPRTLLAARLIEIGWDVRTGARAKHVSRDQFATFHRYLRQAEQILIEVTALEPENAPAWVLRLITVRGLELGQAEARRRYDRLARYHPCSMAGQVQLLQQLCPKWSGSFDEVHAFARECARIAPDGAANGALIPDGHLERWLQLRDDGQRAEANAYLRTPAVQEEILAAAARSVLHPAFRPRFNFAKSHGSFAMALSLAGNHAAAAPHFRALGNQATELPWAYLGDPVAAFQRHRSSALAER